MSVSRTILRDQVKELLLARILSGHYQPGERLVETRIAQELGTSQAPVREALRDLESLRLVESEPFRGARVRAVSEEELGEIYPVRAAIEEVAAREAAVRVNAQLLRALEVELAAMRAAADAGDLLEQARHDVEFHRLIVEASRNRILIDVWGSLRIEARTMITLLRTDVDRRKVAEMHRPIVEALRLGDPRKAGAAVRRHVDYFGRVLRRKARA